MGARRSTVWLVLLVCLGSPLAARAQLHVEVTVAPSTGDPEQDGGLCGVAKTLEVSPGDAVVFCYRLHNDSVAATFTSHDLSDSVNGVILNDFPYSLAPGKNVFLTHTSTITEDTVNQATWSASGTIQASDTDSATVTIGDPGLALEVTVALSTGDPDEDDHLCGVATAIEIAAGQEIVLCYTIENTGEITLNRHRLESELAGVLLNGFSYTLEPGDSVFLTRVVAPTSTTTEIASWTGHHSLNPAYEATAVDAVLVTVPEAAAGALGGGAASGLAGLAAARALPSARRRGARPSRRAGS